MVALFFPGQGSQELGMGKELADNFSVAQSVFEEVNEALAQNLTSIMWGEDKEALTATANAQPAIMAVSIAAFCVMESEFGPASEWHSTPTVVAGHS